MKRIRTRTQAWAAILGTGSLLVLITVGASGNPVSASLLRSVTTTTPAGKTAATTATPTTTTTSATESYSGPWNLTFSDYFGESSLDTAKWNTCYPWFHGSGGCTNFGNPELEWYLPGQDQVSNDTLHLVANETPTAGKNSSFQPETYPWTSGMVTTANSYDFTYGYVQIVAQIPKGDGFLPGLWLLPQTQAWPPEIDIMEDHGNQTNAPFFSNHYPNGTAAGGLQDKHITASEDLSTGYHDYAVDWEPGSITWYLDGQEVYSVNTNVPSQSMYLLMTMTVNGFPGWTTDATTPSSASLNVQSVQIWQH